MAITDQTPNLVAWDLGPHPDNLFCLIHLEVEPQILSF